MSKRKMKTKTKSKSPQADGSKGEKVSADQKETIPLIKEAKGSKPKTIFDDLVGTQLVAYNYYTTKHRWDKKPSDEKLMSKVKRLSKIYKALSELESFKGTKVSIAGTNVSNGSGSLKCVAVPVDTNPLIIKTAPRYVELHDEFSTYDAHMNSGIPLLIEGPKGCGKTLSIASWASKYRCPFIEYDCSEGTKKYDLQGTKTGVAGGLTPFELGFIPRIIECANQFGMAILVLEELNALTPAMQKLLNPLLDWRKGVFITEVGQNYKLEKGKKLAILATTNPSSYQASNDLNEDLQSRFMIWEWDHPNVRQEKKAINWKGSMEGWENRDPIDTDFQKAVMSLAKDSRKMSSGQTPQVGYALATRDIQKIVDGYLQYFKDYQPPKIVDNKILQKTLNMAVLGFYNKASGEKALMKSRIESCFGSEIFKGEDMGTVIDSDKADDKDDSY